MSGALLSLPVELIQSICKAMRRKKSRVIHTVSRLEDRLITEHDSNLHAPHPAVGLSETCHWVRAACIPDLFLTQSLSDLHPNCLPPRTIWPYARTLRIGFTLLRLPDEDYIAMLRGMASLKQVVWCLGAEPMSHRDLRNFLSSPTLEVCRVHRFQFDTVQLIALPPLRILDLSQRGRRPIGIPRSSYPSENFAVEVLVGLFRLSLEVLYIPGESCRLSFLASEPWLSLRELAICGGTPRLDAPFHCVLSTMPLLRAFTLAVVRTHDPQWLLSPRGIPAEDHTPLRELRRVTISDLPPEDLILSRLSYQLTELSLRDTPRHYLRRHNRHLYTTRIATARDIHGILRVSHTAMLSRLELVFRDDGTELQLLSLIATACPNLAFLELHRYAHDDLVFMTLDVSAVDISFGTIASVLSPLRLLRVLRLNYDLGLHCTEGSHTQDLWSMWVARSSAHRWEPFLERQAHLIAEVLPWLESISFLTLSVVMEPRWLTWTHGEMETIGAEDAWAVDQTWF